MTTSTHRALALLAVVGSAMVVVWLGIGPGGASGPATAPSADSTVVDGGADAETAERAFRRVELFRAGGAGEGLTLTSTEVTALLRHSVPAMLPAGVVDPTVRLEDGVVRASARVSSDDFAGRAPLASVLGVLPDTLDVDLSGRLASTPAGLVFYVDEAWVGHVPLPRAAVVSVAKALAVRSGEDLVSAPSAQPALTVGWPSGVAFAEVVGDRLVLRRH